MTLVDNHCKPTVITGSSLRLFLRGQSKKFEDMPRTHARGGGQGQFFEAEDKILALRPACPRGLN